MGGRSEESSGLGGLVAVLAGLLLSSLTDTSTSVADTNVPDGEVTSSANEADGSDSASATITITMYTLLNE